MDWSWLPKQKRGKLYTKAELSGVVTDVLVKCPRILKSIQAAQKADVALGFRPKAHLNPTSWYDFYRHDGYHGPSKKPDDVHDRWRALGEHTITQDDISDFLYRMVRRLGPGDRSCFFPTKEALTSLCEKRPPTRENVKEVIQEDLDRYFKENYPEEISRRGNPAIYSSDFDPDKLARMGLLTEEWARVYRKDIPWPHSWSKDDCGGPTVYDTQTFHGRGGERKFKTIKALMAWCKKHKINAAKEAKERAAREKIEKNRVVDHIRGCLGGRTHRAKINKCLPSGARWHYFEYPYKSKMSAVMDIKGQSLRSVGPEMGTKTEANEALLEQLFKEFPAKPQPPPPKPKTMTYEVSEEHPKGKLVVTEIALDKADLKKLSKALYGEQIYGKQKDLNIGHLKAILAKKDLGIAGYSKSMRSLSSTEPWMVPKWQAWVLFKNGARYEGPHEQKKGDAFKAFRAQLSQDAAPEDPSYEMTEKAIEQSHQFKGPRLRDVLAAEPMPKAGGLSAKAFSWIGVSTLHGDVCAERHRRGWGSKPDEIVEGAKENPDDKEDRRSIVSRLRALGKEIPRDYANIAEIPVEIRHLIPEIEAKAGLTTATGMIKKKLGPGFSLTSGEEIDQDPMRAMKNPMGYKVWLALEETAPNHYEREFLQRTKKLLIARLQEMFDKALAALEESSGPPDRWSDSTYGNVYVQRRGDWLNLGAEVDGRRKRYGWNGDRWARRRVPPGGLVAAARAQGWLEFPESSAGAGEVEPTKAPPKPEPPKPPKQTGPLTPLPGDITIRKGPKSLYRVVYRESERIVYFIGKSDMEYGERVWVPYIEPVERSKETVSAQDFTSGNIKKWGKRLLEKYLHSPGYFLGESQPRGGWSMISVDSILPIQRLLYAHTEKGGWTDVTAGTMPAGARLKPLKKDSEVKLTPLVNAAKLSQLLEKLDEAIEHNRHSAIGDQNPTARRIRIASGMSERADYLDEVKDAIEVLTDLADANALPPALSRLSSKAAIETVLDPNHPFGIYRDRVKELIDDTKGLQGVASQRAGANDWLRSHPIQRTYEVDDTRLWQMFHKLVTAGKAAKIWKSWEMPEFTADAMRMIRCGIDSKAKFEAAHLRLTNEVKMAREKVHGERETARKARYFKERMQRIALQKIPGFFPTPEGLVGEMVTEADIEPGMKVLEPSAGRGDIASQIRQRHPEVDLEVIELNHSLRELLELQGFDLVGNNFLETTGQWDRILMNPPFEQMQDVDHVRHAYEQLAPGGRLVALMGAGPFFREDKKAQGWRKWLDSVGGSERQIQGAFKSSDRPTGVTIEMVTIDKSDPAQIGAHSGTEKLGSEGRPGAHAI